MAYTEKPFLCASAAIIALALLTGCESSQQKALDQAKAQAVSTNTAQQIQYIDKNGDTVTTTVQPAAPGQPQQIVTNTAPPPPGLKPHSTSPVITPIAANGQPMLNEQTTASGKPVANPQPLIPVNITLPAGTEIAIRINQNINVKHSYAGEHFTGEIVEPISSNGVVIIPHDTPVGGRIDASHRRGHFKGRSILELRLTSMTLNGTEYPLDTHDNVSTRKGKGKRTAGFIGGLTGAGMIIGGIASGGVGLAIGAASGAGVGTLFAGATGNRDIDIPAESIMHFRLADQLVVQAP